MRGASSGPVGYRPCTRPLTRHDASVAVLFAIMTARASAAWAHLAEVESLRELHVVVRPGSPLALPGCVGILRLHGTFTVAVSHSGLVEPAASIMQSLPGSRDVGDSIAPALEQDVRVEEVVAQASLFFAWERPSRLPPQSVVRGIASDADQLLGSVPPQEADESGLGDVTSALSMIRGASGQVLAACGYVHWPSDVAHMCVLTHPAHRRKGHGVSAAADAVAHALDERLLPQWRARPEPSKALARVLGMAEMGEQVSIRIRE